MTVKKYFDNMYKRCLENERAILLGKGELKIKLRAVILNFLYSIPHVYVLEISTVYGSKENPIKVTSIKYAPCNCS